MNRVSLRKLRKLDKKYFGIWWRDKDLCRLTSGSKSVLTDKKLNKYFSAMFKNEWHRIILLNKKAIGHCNLEKGRNGWYETQIIIGDKKEWGKGYGTSAIKKLLAQAKRKGIRKIFLYVRETNKRAIHAYKKCGFIPKEIKKFSNNSNLPRALKMILVK